MKTKFEVMTAAADQEYVSNCIWARKIEKHHCERIIDSAKRLVEYAKRDPEQYLLTSVSDFEYAMRDHEMVRRRQMKALMYLVDTKIL